MAKCSICGGEASSTHPIILKNGTVIDWGQGCACGIGTHDLTQALEDGTLRLAVPARQPAAHERPAAAHRGPKAILAPHSSPPRR